MTDTLTYAALCEMHRQWQSEMTGPSALRVIEVQPIPIYGPVKRHRKRRIQKKWLRRHGQRVVGFDRYLGDQLFVDQRSGVAYCHPDVAARVRYMTMRVETENARKFTTNLPLLGLFR